LDIASLVGLLLGLVMVVFGIVTGDGGFSLLPNFVDVPSVLITIGGSLAGVIACNKLSFLGSGFKGIVLSMKEPGYNPQETITNIINLANVARKEGLLALEEGAAGIEDEFLKKGIMLVVDGTDPDLLRGILENDLNCTEERHKQVAGFWEKWAELGPAWGMIGTLIGLVNMLKNLEDATTIGPNMAVALLTTLYGSLIANWLCNPTASKLKLNNANEMIIKQIVVEGLLSIQAGENPHVIEEKLKTFINPKAREGLGESAGGGEE
jgi:chemotaxis protein MotA